MPKAQKGVCLCRLRGRTGTKHPGIPEPPEDALTPHSCPCPSCGETHVESGLKSSFLLDPVLLVYKQDKMWTKQLPVHGTCVQSEDGGPMVGSVIHTFLPRAKPRRLLPPALLLGPCFQPRFHTGVPTALSPPPAASPSPLRQTPVLSTPHSKAPPPASLGSSEPYFPPPTSASQYFFKKRALPLRKGLMANGIMIYYFCFHTKHAYRIILRGSLLHFLHHLLLLCFKFILLLFIW